MVDESEIENLTREGLVVSFVERIGQPGSTADIFMNLGMRGTSAFAKKFAPSASKGRPLPVTPGTQSTESKIRSRDKRRSTYYVVRFHGPITDDRSKKLRAMGIELLERLTRNRYTVHLKPSQVEAVAGLPFVDFVSLYSRADTLQVSDDALEPPPTDAPLPAETAGTAARPRRTRRTRVYSVKLHRAKDLPEVVKWLAKRNRKPLTVTDFGGLDVGIPQAMRRSIDFAANSHGIGAG